MFTKADSAQPYIYRLFAANGNCWSALITVTPSETVVAVKEMSKAVQGVTQSVEFLAGESGRHGARNGAGVMSRPGTRSVSDAVPAADRRASMDRRNGAALVPAYCFPAAGCHRYRWPTVSGRG